MRTRLIMDHYVSRDAIYVTGFIRIKTSILLKTGKLFCLVDLCRGRLLGTVVNVAEKWTVLHPITNKIIAIFSLITDHKCWSIYSQWLNVLLVSYEIAKFVLLNPYRVSLYSFRICTSISLDYSVSALFHFNHMYCKHIQSLPQTFDQILTGCSVGKISIEYNKT